jgi:glycosyltransferase involved in cell wall biosynthesis
MINNKYISLVLPCKNEARALSEVLSHIPKEVDEVIVVDNNSNDKTGKIAKSFGAKVIKENREQDGIGYGYSLATGIREAKGNIVVCMDGDGSYPIYEISRLVRIMDKEKMDFISCNRIPFKNKKNMSSIRTFGVKALNIVFWLLYGYRIQDCLSGMWIFNRNVIDNIVLFEGNWNFSLEIKLNTAMNPLIRFTEHPIYYHDRIFDSSKQNLFKTGIQHLIFLFKRKFNYSKSRFSLLKPKPSLSY